MRLDGKTKVASSPLPLLGRSVAPQAPGGTRFAFLFDALGGQPGRLHSASLQARIPCALVLEPTLERLRGAAGRHLGGVPAAGPGPHACTVRLRTPSPVLGVAR